MIEDIRNWTHDIPEVKSRYTMCGLRLSGGITIIASRLTDKDIALLKQNYHCDVVAGGSPCLYCSMIYKIMRLRYLRHMADSDEKVEAAMETEETLSFLDAHGLLDSLIDRMNKVMHKDKR